MKVFDLPPHRVTNHDVMKWEKEIAPVLMQGEKAHLFYSDPPWGQGNLKFWETMNVKNNEGVTRPENDHGQFVENIFRIAKQYTHPAGWVIIHYGIKWRQEIIQLGARYGMHLVDVIDVAYRGGGKVLPQDMYVFSLSKGMSLPPSYKEQVTGTLGYKNIKVSGEPLSAPGKILLDPCCGKGYAAQLAIDTGMRFRGNELNQYRLNDTIKRIKKAIGQP